MGVGSRSLEIDQGVDFFLLFYIVKMTSKATPVVVRKNGSIVRERPQFALVLKMLYNREIIRGFLPRPH